MAVEEKVTDLSSSALTGKQLEAVLDRLFKENKPNIENWHKQMMADHEDNFIFIDSHVAVIDVGINQIGSWDGANGYHEMTAEQYVDWKQSLDPKYEADESVFLTKQGLVKRYRFMLIINDQGEPDIISNPYIVPANQVPKSNVSSVEMLQRRIDI